MSCPERQPRTRSKRRWYKWLTALAILAGLVALAAAPAKRKPEVSGLVRVDVSERGFLPSSVTVAADAPVELEFLRTTEETCASSVAFPELGISEPLALNKPVRIKVPPSVPRTLSFQCGVGDHRSAVIVN